MSENNLHLDPFPHYARMRVASPVYFQPERKVWEVYGYHDIQTVINDHATFSSDVFGGDKSKQSMVMMDPPRHTQIRKLVSRAFTAQAVADLETRIEAITHDLLDEVIGAGRMDLISDFAFPLPVTIIAELLGVPATDRDRFKHWSNASVLIAAAKIKGQQVEPRHLEALGQFMQYLERLAEDRKRAPRNDLASSLVAANIDGESLTIDEVTNTCRLLLVAGHETTTNLIGNAVYTLLEHPAALAQLRAEPELLPSAIEEVLRYRSPVQFVGRITTRDVELGGQRIQAGQRIVAFVGSGNRDGEAFPNPDLFDITRSPNRHLSFGHGIHFCLGAMLSRLEARIALQAILNRLPELRLEDGARVEQPASNTVFGLARLPLMFTPPGKHAG